MNKEIEASMPINKLGFGKSDKTHQYLAVISVGFIAIGSGTVLAWSSPALTELSVPLPNTTNHEDSLNINVTRDDSPTIVLSKQEEALIGATLTLGAMISAIPTGYIADRFGRKVAIYSSGIAFLLGWFLIVFAKNVETLLAARFFGGVGLGGIFAIAPVYVGEIAENSIRATLASYFQCFLSLGILTTFIIGAFTDYVTMSAILAVFPVMMFLSFPFFPESQVYLVKKGKMKEAEQSLRRFRGNNPDYDIQGEMSLVIEEVNKNKASGRFSDIITNKSNRNAVIVVVGLLSLQQLSGICAMTFYSEQIFAAAGTNINASTGAVIMFAFQFFSSFATMIVVERAGRKYFLILSGVGMMIGLCGLGMFFHLQKLNMGHLTFGFLPIACAALFNVAFTIGFSTIPFVLVNECLAPEIRGIGSGIGIVGGWICSFILTYSFPISLEILGDHITFYIMTLLNVFAVLFVITLVPETRGKTLFEVQEYFGR